MWARPAQGKYTVNSDEQRAKKERYTAGMHCTHLNCFAQGPIDWVGVQRQISCNHTVVTWKKALSITIRT